MTSLVIRLATIKDITSIIKIRLETLSDEEIDGFSTSTQGDFTYSSKEELRKIWLRESKLEEGFEILVAEKNRKIMGFIVFKVDSNCVYIDNIIISRCEQKRGLGRALVKNAEKIGKTRNCELMKTDTTENINGIPWIAYQFWLKMGYEDTGERLPTDNNFKEIPLIKRLNNFKN